ncbi:MAG: TorF family putative porin [Sterolibacterium sp.]|nr:TorF family putative porin [Sterolibacterium sp.]
MKINLVALTLAAAVLLPAASFAQTAEPAASVAAPASPFTGNVMLASEYLYRGIAQTRGKPAIQGGFDFVHPSGFYIGTWGSNISWFGDNNPGSSASLELDIYGGYKGAISGDLGYDVGVLTYNYPGNYLPGVTKPNTTEVYGALTWKWLSAKYSYSTTDLFGTLTPTGGNTKGSGYLDLTGTFDLGGGWGAVGHAGHQTMKDFSAASYSDWKLGVTKDVGIGSVGLAVLGTNARDKCGVIPESYCIGGYEAGKNRALLTFGKTL